MKIIMRNFQSIVSAALEIDGFTVITGPSNRGKSALVRAIDAALFNNSNARVIRDGAFDATVFLNLENKISIKWNRPKMGSVSLEVNGVLQTRVSREYEKLIRPYGFWPVETKNKTFKPQIAHQHDPLFLLIDSPNTVAEVLQIMGRVDIVSTANRLCIADLKVTRGSLSHQKDESARIAHLIQPYGDLQSVLDDLARVTLLTHGTKDEVYVYQQMLSDTKFVQTVESIDDIPDVPDFDFDGLVLRMLDLEHLVNFEEFKNFYLPEVPAAPDLSELIKLEDILQELIKVKYDIDSNIVDILACDRAAKETEKLKSEIEQELSVCPTCNRPYKENTCET